MGAGVLGVLATPLRTAKRLLINILQLADGSYALALPVAGLDEEAAHQILSTLRAAEHDEVSHVHNHTYLGVFKAHLHQITPLCKL